MCKCHKTELQIHERKTIKPKKIDESTIIVEDFNSCPLTTERTTKKIKSDIVKIINVNQNALIDIYRVLH